MVGVFDENDVVLIKKFKGLCGDVPFISVQNKIDINPLFDGGVFDCSVSAKTGEGFDVLKGLIVSGFKKGIKKEDYKYIVRDRHESLFKSVVGALDQVLNNLNSGESLELVAEDLKIARGFLDELVGRKFSDSLLGDIFNNNCIGK